MKGSAWLIALFMGTLLVLAQPASASGWEFTYTEYALDNYIVDIDPPQVTWGAGAAIGAEATPDPYDPHRMTGYLTGTAGVITYGLDFLAKEAWAEADAELYCVGEWTEMWTSPAARIICNAEHDTSATSTAEDDPRCEAWGQTFIENEYGICQAWCRTPHPIVDECDHDDSWDDEGWIGEASGGATMITGSYATTTVWLNAYAETYFDSGYTGGAAEMTISIECTIETSWPNVPYRGN